MYGDGRLYLDAHALFSDVFALFVLMLLAAPILGWLIAQLIPIPRFPMRRSVTAKLFLFALVMLFVLPATVFAGGPVRDWVKKHRPGIIIKKPTTPVPVAPPPLIAPVVPPVVPTPMPAPIGGPAISSFVIVGGCPNGSCPLRR